MSITDDVRIKEIRSLVPASVLLDELPMPDNAAKLVSETRQSIANCINGIDDRVVILVGPCSVHDYNSAVEYAENLSCIIDKYQGELLIIMRVYFEKPRTTVGWKGFINDPDLDGSFKINKGLKEARKLLLELLSKGVPCGTEYLDVISPQYISDLMSWGAIGARTTESQTHRELSSGLSCPIGFKNGTHGNIQIAVDAIKSARSEHHFLGVTKNGTAGIVSTKGNTNTHVILRGGSDGPNYYKENIDYAIDCQNKSNLDARIMIDCSHGNSEKDYVKQPIVAASVSEMIASGNSHIFGVMVESHLKSGNQKITENMTYGQSITDACISWDMTEEVFDTIANAVKARRAILEL